MTYGRRYGDLSDPNGPRAEWGLIVLPEGVDLSERLAGKIIADFSVAVAAAQRAQKDSPLEH